MILYEIFMRLWERVGCDLFEFDGKDYLIYVDYFLDFFEIDRLYGKIGKEVIGKMKVQIVCYGILDVIVIDNGFLFNSGEFRDFVEKYEFEYRILFFCYFKLNGKVENVVKIVKYIMCKCVFDKKDIFLVFLDQKNMLSKIIELFVVE